MGPSNRPKPLEASNQLITRSISVGYSRTRIAEEEVIDIPAPIPAMILEQKLIIIVSCFPPKSSIPISKVPNPVRKRPIVRIFFLPNLFMYFPAMIDVGRPKIGSMLKITPIIHIGIPFDSAIPG